ncbi:hypothetical protein Y032_0336g2888 [Ancylostoma ceylanicum]|uniref:Glycosyl hydrolase, family 1 n=1 Tax=Ancylostoma ceylanicum TaxID=53326 RepID=A0A016RYG8_9BILA|nr:hypothetical protein Y032_0336g2888 [Ancylostoma ceylanicum]
MMNGNSTFPPNFIWATATAAYQVEGANDKDGRGVSTWDVIRKQPGRIADNSSPSQSCDAYYHCKEDVQLLKELNVSHYRFSICWTRILPNGTISNVNEKGIAFYRSLIEELKANGIEPIAVLFHADYPFELYQRGGWLNPECIQWYLDFCRLCFERFGDLVKYWISFNEIPMHAWCAVTKVEGQPHHSPDTIEHSCPKRKIPYVAAHNMLLAHARAYRTYEKDFKKTQNGKFGIVVGGRWCCTFSTSPEDIAAATRALDWSLNWTVSPIFGKKGDYPDGMKQRMRRLEEADKQQIMPKFTQEETLMLKGSADFLGINYYIASEVCAGVGPSQMEADAHFDYLDDRWERISGEGSWLRYVPEGLLHLLEYVKDNYDNVPVLISENGCADIIGRAAQQHDPLADHHRIRYIKAHIEAVRIALQRGCNVIGYTVWSLMDNFEWDDGFAVRFGLYRVDFDSPQKTRTIKNSGRFLRGFLKEVRGLEDFEQI